MSVQGWFTLDPGWKDQWRRVEAAYNNLPGIRAPSTEFVGREVIDATMLFFMHCHHLKDWVANDPATGLTRDKVEPFAHSTLELRLCGDLCNGAKHFTLTNAKTGDTNTGVRRGTLSGDVVTGFEPRILVASGGSNHVAADIATQCITAWRAFLGKASLL